ncbi:hypothetical protein I350_07136 [Cryptococcus amylolentus CBS 6273]|uniref:Uncharacterized protein n=1 Tax=Cryptococcus amylolentus CBS 6273 TaxID=1296118 RepID=A0A1E3JE88_9TREE|nr:hypothetical protein I350_07136 [Cryptococcus amylolentus CBS 6273]
MLAILPFFALLLPALALPTPNNAPGNSTIAPPRLARNNVPGNSTVAPPRFARNNVPGNSTVAPPRARNNVPGNSTTAPPRLRSRSSDDTDATSAIIQINVPAYTSMLPDPSNASADDAALAGPGTIGIQVWEGDVVEYEWKIQEKAVEDDGEAVDAWSLQCNLTLNDTLKSDATFVFSLSADAPYLSGDSEKEVRFVCSDVQCVKDGGCADDSYDPSFDSSASSE